MILWRFGPKRLSPSLVVWQVRHALLNVSCPDSGMSFASPIPSVFPTQSALRRDLLGLLLRRVVGGEHVFQRGLGDASSAGNEPRQPPVLGQERGGGRRFNFVVQSALVVGVIRVDDRFR